jgi:hypothetical protein
MTTILLAWELGAGLGHVSRLLPIARALRERGFRVVAAVRDIAYAGAALSREGVECLQAPHYFGTSIAPIPSRTFAHILRNVGFGNAECLRALAASWNVLFNEVAPDVVLFDHAPTALLASRGRRFGRILFGDGFCCPPGDCPLPSLLPWSGLPASAENDEAELLANANSVLTQQCRPTLSRLSQLYADVDARLLTTFAELDHFGARMDAEYIGPCTVSFDEPHDVAHRSRRAIAYLHPFAEIETLFAELAQLGIATTAYCPGMRPTRQAVPSNITLVNTPMNLHQALLGCDFAILNATHGATASALLAGRPIFQIPLHHEQQLVAARSLHTGATIAARSNSADNLRNRLRAFLANPRHAISAASFADRHRTYSLAQSIARAANRVEQVLAPAA